MEDNSPGTPYLHSNDSVNTEYNDGPLFSRDRIESFSRTQKWGCRVLGCKRWCCIIFIVVFTLWFLLSMAILIVAYVISNDEPIRLQPIGEAMDVPDAPDPPYIILREIHSITIGWNAPYHHLSVITEYQIQYSYNLIEFITHEPGPGINLNYKLTGLEHGQVYWLRVRAVNALGPGNYSDLSQTTTLNATEPDNPSPPMLHFTSTTSLDVFWYPGNENGAIVSGYELRLSTDGDDWTIRYLGQQNHTVINFLEPYQTYFLQVRTRSVLGPSNWSYIVEYHTDSENAREPDIVTSIGLVRQKCDSISITWPRPDDAGAEILLYISYSSPILGVVDVRQEIPRNPIGINETAVLVGLKPSTTYHIQLVAQNSYGTGALPIIGTVFRTLPPSQTDQPLPPIVIAATSNTIKLRWSQPELNCAGVIGYILERDDWWTDTSFQRIAFQNETEFEEVDLIPSAPYSFRLKTSNNYGDSAYSQVTLMSTFDKGACGNIEDLTAAKENFDRMQGYIQLCLIRCAFPGGGCAVVCVSEGLGLSTSCASCWVANELCALNQCTIECLLPSSERCTNCLQEKCYPDTRSCTGMPDWTFPH